MLEERRKYETDEIPSLTIKDKMNYPYLLATQFLTVQKAILNLQFSEREIKEAVNHLVGMIPDSWKDDDWKEDLKKAEVKRKIDLRFEFCGVKPSLEYCKEAGIIPFREITELEPYQLFHACVNLLDRRGLISRRSKTEKHLGEPFDNDGFEPDEDY